MKVTNWNQEEIQKAIDEMAQKAFADESFMNLCLSDLPTALKEVVDGTPPKGMSVRLDDDSVIIQKENESEMIFDIPPMLGENGELSDAHLEAVAGGGEKGGEVSLGGKHVGGTNPHMEYSVGVKFKF